MDITNSFAPTAEQVLDACATDSVSEVFAAFAACPSPPYIWKLSEIAIKHDRVDIIEHLLLTGTPPSHIWIEPIISKRNTELLELLLNHGWDINEDLGSYRGCALASAILSRAPADFVKWLLDHGADPDGPPALPDHHGYALRLAAHMSNEDEPTEVAKLLLARGADVNRSKALHLAAEEKGINWVQWLVEVGGADVNDPGVDPDLAFGTDGEKLYIGSPLHRAARSGSLDVVRYLLSKGADTRRSKDANGYTPQQVAENLGHGEVASILA